MSRQLRHLDLCDILVYIEYCTLCEQCQVLQQEAALTGRAQEHRSHRQPHEGEEREEQAELELWRDQADQRRADVIKQHLETERGEGGLDVLVVIHVVWSHYITAAFQ